MADVVPRVAVVVPCYRPILDDDERVSLRHLNRFLSSYDRYLALPRSLRFGLDGFATKRFAEGFFRSRRSYSRLLLTRRFYRSFSDYDYILLYQLDSLVFSDELALWCEKGFDYIGAVHNIAGEDLVGNGGFSLRRVQGLLNVLESRRKTSGQPGWRGLVKRLLPVGEVRWQVRRRNRAEWGWSEDWFWSLDAHRYADFRVAPIEEANRFAFFGEPRETFEGIGRRLPFGCHGWTRFDRAFWEPYLLR